MGNTDEGLRRRRQQEPLMQQYSDSEGESAKDDQPEAKRPTAGGSAGHSDVNSFTSSDRIVSLLLTAVCAFTRLYQIGRRNLVSWDETHFGKFGAFYVNRTFYHDVHPPLAKMLVGLSEYISGHNGSFAYKLGTTYPEHVNYVFQRSFVALMSVMLVPFAYRTCRFLRFSRGFAAMAASFMIFDNALCVMSRFILLDQPLLCFTAMSLLGYAAFAAQRGQAFGPAWWRWLVFTGVSLGLVISSKWVGLFVIALVGLCTIEELFGLYSDRTTGAATQIKHWAARAVCLIVIPVAIYLACFKAHFAILNTRGTGDFKMPSAFQARQQNSVVALQPHEVAYGSQVTLRSHLPGFGLIHANESLRFPDKGIQQIAGGMAGKQAFNWWQITSLNGTWENSTSPVQHVNDGDLIRLVHVGTVHYLRTGRETPYYMGWDRRMFLDGNATKSNIWDAWRVEIVDEESPLEKSHLRTVTTTFRLYNVISGCLLQATQSRLPAWGRRMSELICTQANTTRSESTLWNIEQVRDKRFARADFSKLVKRRLVRDTIWLNREMSLSNNALIPDHDRYKTTESEPWSWPLLLYPMRLVSWAKDSIKYYEIGNPVLWWASSFACLLFPLQLLYWFVRRQRHIQDWSDPAEYAAFWDTGKLLWGGWALHYLPFFLMGRVTYLHHYLPALYFALLLLAFEVQCFARWFLPKPLHLAAVLAGIGVAAGVFVLFSPFTFGWDKPAKDLAYLQWLPTWNVYEDRHLL